MMVGHILDLCPALQHAFLPKGVPPGGLLALGVAHQGLKIRPRHAGPVCADRGCGRDLGMTSRRRPRPAKESLVEVGDRAGKHALRRLGLLRPGARRVPSREAAEKVGPADDADQLSIAQNRNALDAIACQQTRDLGGLAPNLLVRVRE